MYLWIPLSVKEYREQMAEEIKKGRHKEFEDKRNIKRDSKGRLNKGAALAKKDSCNEKGILLRYQGGMTVKEIVECMGCSKSTVYNVLSKNKKSKLPRKP